MTILQKMKLLFFFSIGNIDDIKTMMKKKLNFLPRIIGNVLLVGLIIAGTLIVSYLIVLFMAIIISLITLFLVVPPENMGDLLLVLITFGICGEEYKKKLEYIKGKFYSHIFIVFISLSTAFFTLCHIGVYSINSKIR